MRIDVAADAELAAELASRIAADALGEAVAERGRAAIAVSGGTTPSRMLARLAAAPLPWRNIDVFQVDERIVARDDARRNLHGLLAAFADRPVPAAAIHAMPVERADTAAAAADYAETLRGVLGAAMRLDVVHLGLGADGHTASLAPGDAVLASDAYVAVTDAYQGTRRMTMTLRMLDRARLRLWLVTGADKRAVLERFVAADPGLVASRVSRDGGVAVADAAAAG